MALCRGSRGWNIQVPCTISLRQAYGSTGVMSRGDRREDIFLDDVDRQDFIKTLAEACQKAGWEVHAYCLIGELGTSKSANVRLHQFMAPLSSSVPRQDQLRL